MKEFFEFLMTGWSVVWYLILNVAVIYYCIIIPSRKKKQAKIITKTIKNSPNVIDFREKLKYKDYCHGSNRWYW